MSLIRARYRAVNTIMNLPRGGGYVGLLDLFPNAAAAYSLRKLRAAYSGSAVRVRRSSDNTEQDIGFTAQGELDTASLLSFVNASGNAYTSDFTSGNEDMGETGGTGADGQSIAGVSDAYKFTQDSSTGIHRAVNPTNTNIVGGDISISFDYYLPSGQTSDRILFRTNNAADAQVDLTSTDAWTTYSTTFSGIAGDQFWFYSAIVGQGLSFTGNGSDHFYLKNIVVTQTDADGLVSTWYDQSLSNDATQSAGASQPKIVSGGSLVTENGKPAVDFDGVDDVLVKSNPTGMPTGQQARSFFVALKSYLPSSSARDYLSIGDGGTSSDLKKWRLVAEWSVRIFGDSVIYNTILQNTHYLSTNIYNGGTISSNNFYENGVLQSGTGGTSIPNTSAGNLYIGKYPSIINGFDGAIQELIIYSSDQSSNRAAIETNINTFYSIYP